MSDRLTVMRRGSGASAARCPAGMLCLNTADLCNVCPLIFQMSSCSFSWFSAASGPENVISPSVFASGREAALFQRIPPPPPPPLLTSSSTTCLRSVVSLGSHFSPLYLPHLLSTAPSCAPALPLTNRRTDEEDGEDESGASRGGVHDNLYRVHMPSLYSCGSSYGSEASLPATAHTVSNAPVTEYM